MKKTAMIPMILAMVWLATPSVQGAEVYEPRLLLEMIFDGSERGDAMPPDSPNLLGVYGTEGMFERGDDMALDRQGNIYILDPGNCRIQGFNPEGRFLKSVPVPDCFVAHPTDPLVLRHVKDAFTVAGDGNFWVIDAQSGDRQENGDEIRIPRTIDLVKQDDKGKELQRVTLPNTLGGKSLSYRWGPETDMEGNPYFDLAGYDDVRNGNILTVKNGVVRITSYARPATVVQGEVFRIIEEAAQFRVLDASGTTRALVEKVSGPRTFVHVEAKNGLGEMVISVVRAQVGQKGDIVFRKYSVSGEILSEFRKMPGPFSAFERDRLLGANGSYFELQYLRKRADSYKLVEWRKVSP